MGKIRLLNIDSRNKGARTIFNVYEDVPEVPKRHRFLGQPGQSQRSARNDKTDRSKQLHSTSGV
jgi:hypothetical protein